MYKCSVCGKKFKTKQSLGGHMSSHKRKKTNTEIEKLRNINTILLRLIMELMG